MHDIKTDSGQKTAMGIGFFCSTVMLAASAYFNAIFGFRLGQTPMDGAVFAVIGVVFEVFLALMPFYFMNSMRGKAWGTGIFLLFVWLFLIGVSANAAIAHIAGSRLNAMSNRIAATTTYQDDRKELKRLEDRLGWLPQPTESEGALRAKIKSQQSQLLWQQTAECANQWNTTTKTFCGKFTELTSALNNTLEYEVTLTKIAKIKDKLGQQVSQHVGVLAESADAQASLYSKALGVDPTTVSGVLSGIFAAAILMIASMGFYISVAPIRAAQRVKQAAEKAALGTSETLALGTQDGKYVIDITPPPPPPPGRPVGYLASPRELSPDARELLRAIGIPEKPCDKREKDGRDVLGWHLYAWMVGSGHTGEFSPEAIDAFYAAYSVASYRSPWEAMRVVKKELEDIGPRYVVSAMRYKDDGRRGTVWTVKPIACSKLLEVLRKRGIVPKEEPPSEPDAPNAAFQQPAPTPPKNVLSFFRRGAEEEQKKASGG